MVGQVGITNQIIQMGNGGLKRVSDLSEVTKLQSDRVSTGIQPHQTKTQALLFYYTDSPSDRHGLHSQFFMKILE